MSTPSFLNLLHCKLLIHVPQKMICFDTCNFNFFIFAELQTEINGWDRFNYAKTFDCGLHTVNDNVDRVDARYVSEEEFREKYEKTYTPCVIVNDQLEWPARKKWSINVSNENLKAPITY